MVAEIRVVPSEAFARVAAALKDIDEKMVSNFREDMRREVEPFVLEAERNIIDMPVKPGNRAGFGALRRAIAAGVTTRVDLVNNAGVRILTHEPKPGAAIIPRGFDRAEGWRHPVFGRRTWVRQVPIKPGWFVETFRDAKEPIEQGLLHVLDRAAKQVGAAGDGFVSS